MAVGKSPVKANMTNIPVYKPFLFGNETKYVMNCLDSTWISSQGKYIDEFEQKFAEYIGVKYATTVVNGTMALHLSLVALGVGPGDEVIVPTLTYVASANAITYTGAVPVFADSLENTWQIDPEDVRRKITSKTRGIIAVHLYGHPAEMDLLEALAREYNLFLIEDCAEAVGTRYKARHVGGFGNISTFSFYGNKTITSGEGGMVATNDPILYEKAVRLKGQGAVKKRHYYHDRIGYNYQMTNICAAIGLAQLEQIHEILQKKRHIARQYQEVLQGLPLQFHDEVGDVFHSYWMCSILTSDPAQRDLLRHFLANDNIETRPVFYPVHTMPMYLQKSGCFAVAENISSRGINLPSWPGLEKSDVEFIGTCIRQFIQSRA
ncbi:MAG: DegT/DnrJ/EryC1/StrS aminotransferase [Firmicutes bacterium]|nr:DegT/DnrJ/EryC1/StrS aminotransferase [Bacillota bacterium]